MNARGSNDDLFDIFQVDHQEIPVSFDDMFMFDIEQFNAEDLSANLELQIPKDPDEVQRGIMGKHYARALQCIKAGDLAHFSDTLLVCRIAHDAYGKIAKTTKSDDCCFIRVLALAVEFIPAFNEKYKNTQCPGLHDIRMMPTHLLALRKKYAEDDEVNAEFSVYFFHLNQYTIRRCCADLAKGDLDDALDSLHASNVFLLSFPDKSFSHQSMLDGKSVCTLQWQDPYRHEHKENSWTIGNLLKSATDLAMAYSAFQPGRLDRFNLYIAIMLVFGNLDGSHKKQANAMIVNAMSNLKNTTIIVDKKQNNAYSLFSIAMRKAFNIVKDKTLNGEMIINENAYRLFAQKERFEEFFPAKPTANVQPLFFQRPPAPKEAAAVKETQDNKREAEVDAQNKKHIVKIPRRKK